MEFVLDSESREIEFRGSIAGLLKELGLMREEVVVKLNGRLAPDTAEIKSNDKVEVIRVVFGG